MSSSVTPGGGGKQRDRDRDRDSSNRGSDKGDEFADAACRAA